MKTNRTVQLTSSVEQSVTPEALARLGDHRRNRARPDGHNLLRRELQRSTVDDHLDGAGDRHALALLHPAEALP